MVMKVMREERGVVVYMNEDEVVTMVKMHDDEEQPRRSRKHSAVGYMRARLHSQSI